MGAADTSLAGRRRDRELWFHYQRHGARRLGATVHYYESAKVDRPSYEALHLTPKDNIAELLSMTSPTYGQSASFS